MQFFVDTADTTEIKEFVEMGILDGVTTNPSLIAKSGRKFLEVVAEICALVKGPVSAEVTALDTPTMLKEAKVLSKIAKNVVIKLPLTTDGLKACRTLTDAGVKTNVTLCFSAAQALLAAKAGATYISPFVGRLDDIGQEGMGLIAEIKQMYKQYPAIETQILVASTRHPRHIVQAAMMGADVATIPPSVLRTLIKHPLTDRGLESFMADWKKTGQSIL
ncbi:MAG: fructose-6-phosphate aldolase [Proteobacteria bacterium]|nr:fructose-6-phosphate aldolase [Pseudomonadota bacterium]